MKTGAIFEPATTPAAGIIDIGDRKQHFLDDLLVDEASRVSRYANRPDKYPGTPIMVADRPWEQGKYGGRGEGVEIVGQTVLYDECEVRAALTDPSGGVIEGFTFERSSQILKSGPHEITWGEADLSRLQGEAVRLHLEIRNACLYSIQFKG